MEYELDLDDVRELMLNLEHCSGFLDYSFVLPADKLNVGKNLIRIVLRAGATTGMFVKRIKTAHLLV